MFIANSHTGYLAKDFGIKDKNDCAIRAIANVSPTPYPELRQRMMELGRRVNRGTPWTALNKMYKEQGARDITIWGKAGRKIERWTDYDRKVETGISVANFIKAHQTGRYIVVIRKHAFALINGQIVDYVNNKAKSRVMASYYFGE